MNDKEKFRKKADILREFILRDRRADKFLSIDGSLYNAMDPKIKEAFLDKRIDPYTYFNHQMNVFIREMRKLYPDEPLLQNPELDE